MVRKSAQAIEMALARLAGNQHGVVSFSQLLALGLSADAIQKRVRRGRFHRVHRGVFAVGHAKLTPQGRWMAAVLACGESAVAPLAAAGFEVLRFTWRQVVKEPGDVVAALQARLTPALLSCSS